MPSLLGLGSRFRGLRAVRIVASSILRALSSRSVSYRECDFGGGGFFSSRSGSSESLVHHPISLNSHFHTHTVETMAPDGTFVPSAVATAANALGSATSDDDDVHHAPEVKVGPFK